MLKLALIVHLRRLSEELLESRAGRREADRCFAAFENARPGGRTPPLPAVLHVAFVDRLLQRMREYGWMPPAPRSRTPCAPSTSGRP